MVLISPPVSPMDIAYLDTTTATIRITIPVDLGVYTRPRRCAQPEKESDLPLPCNHNPDGTRCDLCTEIAGIEALPSPSSELQLRLRALRSQRNTLCPISKLPYDIVSYIFILSLPPIIREFMPDYEPSCSNFAMSRLPLRLSAVCASWRRLTCSIPQLWSTLSINVFQTKPEDVIHRLQFSGSVPLRVQLSAPRHVSITQSPVLGLITLVKQNLHRIAFLCLNLPCQLIKQHFSQNSNIPHSLPILKELHSHCSVSGLRGMCAEPHNFILSFYPPAPHKVNLTSTSLTNIDLNWDAVRHLSLESTKSSHPKILGTALRLLQVSSRLFAVDFTFLPNPPLDLPLVVIQNTIRVLRLFHTSETLLAHLTLPHLESLKLWQSDPDPTNLVSFLQRSACPLTTMVWKPTQLALVEHAQALIDVFKCTPKLERLSLVITNDQPSEVYVVPFLKSLSTGEGDSEPLLPLLEEFCYTGPLVHAPLSLFLDIAEKRFKPETTSGGGDGDSGDQETTTRKIRPFKGLGVYRFQPDEEIEPIEATDWERILVLNADLDIDRFSVLEFDESCEMSRTDFSDFYDKQWY